MYARSSYANSFQQQRSSSPAPQQKQQQQQTQWDSAHQHGSISIPQSFENSSYPKDSNYQSRNEAPPASNSSSSQYQRYPQQYQMQRPPAFSDALHQQHSRSPLEMGLHSNAQETDQRTISYVTPVGQYRNPAYNYGSSAPSAHPSGSRDKFTSPLQIHQEAQQQQQSQRYSRPAEEQQTYHSNGNSSWNTYTTQINSSSSHPQSGKTPPTTTLPSPANSPASSLYNNASNTIAPAHAPSVSAAKVTESAATETAKPSPKKRGRKPKPKPADAPASDRSTAPTNLSNVLNAVSEPSGPGAVFIDPSQTYLMLPQAGTNAEATKAKKPRAKAAKQSQLAAPAQSNEASEEPPKKKPRGRPKKNANTAPPPLPAEPRPPPTLAALPAMVSATSVPTPEPAEKRRPGRPPAVDGPKRLYSAKWRDRLVEKIRDLRIFGSVIEDESMQEEFDKLVIQLEEMTNGKVGQ